MLVVILLWEELNLWLRYHFNPYVHPQITDLVCLCLIVNIFLMDTILT